MRRLEDFIGKILLNKITDFNEDEQVRAFASTTRLERSNTLELCIKVARRHYSFTNFSFSFSLFLLLHFDDFNVCLKTVSFSLGFIVYL